MWFIWKSRNKKVFQNADLEFLDILYIAESEFLAWTEAQSSIPRIREAHNPLVFAVKVMVFVERVGSDLGAGLILLSGGSFNVSWGEKPKKVFVTPAFGDGKLYYERCRVS